MDGQPAELHRLISTPVRLPRPVYTCAESLCAGSWTSHHRHAWAQFSYAISGVFGVHIIKGSFFVLPRWVIWIPVQLEHEVVTSTRVETRNLCIHGDACAWAPTRYRVLETTSLACELTRGSCRLPVDYPGGDSAESRLVQVLLDQLRLLPEIALPLSMPHEPRLLWLCQALIDEPTQSPTMGGWTQHPDTLEKTLSHLFQHETGMNYRLWHQRQRLLASLNALEAGDNVTGVALDSGRDSTSAYIAAFKGLFGFTPDELFHQH